MGFWAGMLLSLGLQVKGVIFLGHVDILTNSSICDRMVWDAEAGPTAGQHEFESWPGYFSAVQSWAAHMILLPARFLTCKMGMIIVPSHSVRTQEETIQKASITVPATQ